MRWVMTILVLLARVALAVQGTSYIKTNTATTICIGPFRDGTDHETPETGLTVADIDCELVWDNAGTPTLIELSLTASGGDNDCALLSGSENGIYTLELTAANVNYLGGGTVTLRDPNNTFDSFSWSLVARSANVHDSLIAGSDVLRGSVYEIDSGGSDQTVDDLEDFADAGYDPTNDGVNVYTVLGSTPVSASDVQDECEEALVAKNLDHLAYTSADLDNDVADNSVFGQLLSTDGDASNFAKATDSMQAIRDYLAHATYGLNALYALLTPITSWVVSPPGYGTYPPVNCVEWDGGDVNKTSDPNAWPMVTLANGAHGGAAATITLQNLTISNGSGTAITISGSGGHGIVLSATNGYPLQIDGTAAGASTPAVLIEGDNDTVAIEISNAGGDGVSIMGSTMGLVIEGQGDSGIYVSGAGTGTDIELENKDPLPVNVLEWNTTNVATPDTAGYPKVTLKHGTGTGEISLTSGKVSPADDSITSATIATGAIGSDELAATAGTEIITALLDTAISGTVSLEDALQGVIAVWLGESENVDADTWRFYDLDGTTLRVTIDYGANNTRTTITLVED